ncbi:MAG: homoserine dehydrogenase [Candidatus Diapherotrites archaeon]|nr:homoserine dehydrogenase [Candidatus Diapherotrites archaeon]
MPVEVNVGLVGLGNIGSGVLDILKENSEIIEKRTGVRINLVAACDKSKEQLEKAITLGIPTTENFKDLLNNEKIGVIIELIGGYEPAHSIIIDALRAKKHVITANKAVLAKYGTEIFAEAQKNNVNVLFEAAVGGCIPIIRTIEESYSSDRIEKIYGILNGTTNFILTRMGEGMSYEEALKKAQELGFAEADPSFDVEGKDTAQKLSILAGLAFDAKIGCEIFTEGITKITKSDIDFAKELGYVIKLLAIAKKENGQIELRVHPTMIPASHFFANISNEFNAVLLSGANTGEILLSGKGAGKLPTATVVVTDIIELGSRVRVTQRNFENVKIMPFEEVTSRFLLRLNVADKPGILAEIAKSLGNNGISIAALSQKETNMETVPIILITHKASEGQLIKAIKEFESIKEIREKASVLRIEDFD